jgi:putative transposase
MRGSHDNSERLGTLKQRANFSMSRVETPSLREPTVYIGVDRNITKHIAIAALPTGTVLKLGKQAPHNTRNTKNIRKGLQKKGRYGAIKKIKNRESRIIKDINHKISRKLVDIAQQTGSTV